MRGLRMSGARLGLAAAVLATILPASGCVGVASQLMYFFKGEFIDAKYPGLKGKKVAVICASPNQTTNSNGVPQRLSQGVGTLLATHVKGIKVVPQDAVDNWIDRNDWDRIDCKAVGRG